jgi:hypothetical protein
MSAPRKPSVLFVFYSYTKQTLKVVQAMAEVLRGRGCDVQLGAIEFIDPRYADRFKEFPMPHPFREVVGMIPAELRRRPGKMSRQSPNAGIKERTQRAGTLVAAAIMPITFQPP